jgi:hypothetical protein
MSILSKLFTFEKNPLDTYSKELALINSYKEEISGLSQEDIRAEIKRYKEELAELKKTEQVLKKLEQIRPRVFALTREAAKRSIGQFHYDVQIISGLVLAEGKIAEMKTGEGKTLTATTAVVLYSLAGRGVHLVTVNDYLARWHASLMGPVYHYLGLSIASIQHEQSFLYDPTYKPEAEEKEHHGNERGNSAVDNTLNHKWSTDVAIVSTHQAHDTDFFSGKVNRQTNGVKGNHNGNQNEHSCNNNAETSSAGDQGSQTIDNVFIFIVVYRVDNGSIVFC